MDSPRIDADADPDRRLSRPQVPVPLRGRRTDLTADLVARVFRHIPDPGPDPERECLSDAEYAAMTDDVMARIDPAHGLWVFAYGSLLWNPTFVIDGEKPALVHGWHRAYCLHLTTWRGTPEQPGLMLGLTRGGTCRGVVFKVRPGDERADVEKLLRREIVYRKPGNRAHWFRARCPEGIVPALGFVAEPNSDIFIVPPPLAETAQMLARACGHGGSCAEYLYRTVAALDERGIRDNYLWQLQAMVARLIREDHQGPS